jgi:hypothetical protein
MSCASTENTVDAWLCGPCVCISPEAAQNIVRLIASQGEPDTSGSLFWRVARRGEALARAKRVRPHVPHPKAKIERNAEIRELHHNGMTLREIARAYDITDTRVKYILREDKR